MRRLFVLAALLAIVCCGKAQNVQLHYDFGGALYDKDLHGRPVLTSTVEMFKADKWGSTYFFVDMDYTSKGVAAGYWEIARELRFWQPPFSIHVEYNGGVYCWGTQISQPRLTFMSILIWSRKSVASPKCSSHWGNSTFVCI